MRAGYHRPRLRGKQCSHKPEGNRCAEIERLAEGRIVRYGISYARHRNFQGTCCANDGSVQFLIHFKYQREAIFAAILLRAKLSSYALIVKQREAAINSVTMGSYQHHRLGACEGHAPSQLFHRRTSHRRLLSLLASK